MARRDRNRHPWADEPERLLGIGDPYGIWSKLNWEAHQLQALRRSKPPLDIDGMTYLLQNACVSAVAAVEWLGNAINRAERRQRHATSPAFESAVVRELPNLPLAHAIANTFKHEQYRDEGWGDAQIRFEILFSPEQRERLRRAEGTPEFEDLFDDEAAGADIQISFATPRGVTSLGAEELAMDLANGVLRLLDQCSDGDGGFASPD